MTRPRGHITTTRKTVAVLGAPSNLGIRPDDDGTLRKLDRAPAVLRSHGLVELLGAQDVGDVLPPPYVDFVRPPDGVRNESALAAYNDALAQRIADAGREGRFIVVVGGDCSILVASAASLCLAMVVGRGDTPLARTMDDAPLVQPRDVVLLGRRDETEPYGHEGLRTRQVLDVPYADIRTRGTTSVLASATEAFGEPHLGGFWVHVDADVFDASVMQAVDSPTPNGPGLDDEKATCAELLVEFLARALAARGRAA